MANFHIKFSSLLKVSNTIRGRFKLQAIYFSCNNQMVRVNVDVERSKGNGKNENENENRN